jgi:hypothetical protein
MEKDDLEVLAMYKEVSEIGEDHFQLHLLTFINHVGASKVSLLPPEDRISHHTE